MFSSPRWVLAAATTAAVLVLAGCASSGAVAGSSTSPSSSAISTKAAMPSDARMSSGAMASPGETGAMSGDTMAMTAPTAAQAAWKKLPITDSSGKTFTIGDLKGKPVFLEFFATWCPTCRAQLKTTNAAAQKAGSNAVFIALSVETDLNVSDVAKYRSENNFDNVTFAVMSPAMLAAVVACFGNDAANPPSTPHVLVSSRGAVGNLHTGTEAADAITASLTGA